MPSHNITSCIEGLPLYTVIFLQNDPAAFMVNTCCRTSLWGCTTDKSYIDIESRWKGEKDGLYNAGIKFCSVKQVEKVYALYYMRVWTS